MSRTNPISDNRRHNHLTTQTNVQRAANRLRQDFPEERYHHEIGRSSEFRQEIVGKDHNRISVLNQKWTLYPYPDNEDFISRKPDVPVHVTYHVGRNQTQTSRLPKLLVVAVVVVVAVLIGFVFWFVRGQNTVFHKGSLTKQKHSHPFHKPTPVQSPKPSLKTLHRRPQLIVSQGKMFQCPLPGFISKDRCIKCPSNAAWDGSNCVVSSKPLSKGPRTSAEVPAAK